MASFGATTPVRTKSSSKVSDYVDDEDEEVSGAAKKKTTTVLGFLFGKSSRTLSQQTTDCSSTKTEATPTKKKSSSSSLFSGKKKERMSEQPFSPGDFERLRRVGAGGFGVVYLVRKANEPNKHAIYAMKVLRKSKIQQKGGAGKAKLERDVLRYVKHPFVTRLRYAFQTRTRLYLVTDFYVGGTLTRALRSQGENLGLERTLEAVRFYACELGLALTHLHSKGIVHRDVKPSNILVDRRGHVALCDFGIAGVVETCASPARHPLREFVGTHQFMAPELIKKASYYGSFVDWWALGVVLFELQFGASPFDVGQGPRDTMKNILHAEPAFPPDAKLVEPTFISLVSRLLDKSSETRLADDEFFEHPFLSVLDVPAVLRRDVDPPLAPLLPRYVAIDHKGDIVCLERDADLPALNDDGESDHDDDDDPPSRSSLLQDDSFKGFAYAGDDRNTHKPPPKVAFGRRA